MAAQVVLHAPQFFVSKQPVKGPVYESNLTDFRAFAGLFTRLIDQLFRLVLVDP